MLRVVSVLTEMFQSWIYVLERAIYWLPNSPCANDVHIYFLDMNADHHAHKSELRTYEMNGLYLQDTFTRQREKPIFQR
jgi:hypothetical protein